MLLPFRTIWCADFEFGGREGDLPSPRCLVSTDALTGRSFRIWEGDLLHLRRAPFDVGPDSVMVAYYASAEVSCFHALGWPPPENVIDLYVEFRRITNGLTLPCGRGLLGALAFYGLPAIEVAEKETMRELALRGGPWTDEERHALLDYCASDVDALVRLLPLMVPHILS